MAATSSTMDYRLLFAAFLAAFLAIAAIPTIDIPISRACLAGDLPGDIVKGINTAECFAHGVGIALICLSFWVLDRRKHMVLRLLALPALTGLAGNLSKLVVARLRPNEYYDTVLPPVLETFKGFPGSLDSDWQSLPSGHTATAVGLAVALSRLYPRAYPLFAAFALFAACQRVTSGAHFTSDTFAAAAIAFAIASFTANRLFWDAAWGGHLN